MIFKEIDFCGIYLPPLFPCLLVAGVIFVFLHRWWDRLVIQRWVWNRPVFELAMFIILLAVVTFIL
jgi:hypothetical protein